MGYLMMCALSAWAGRSGRCVLPFLSPRGTLSTWCVERAVAAATRQGVPRARLRDRVVDLLRVVMRPSEPVANERAGRRRTHAAAWTPRRRPRGKLNARWIVDTVPRRPAAGDLAGPGMANGHPAVPVTWKRRKRSCSMWATEDALQESRAERRAIDPAAVERMFDAARGTHISPGELAHLWRGQPGPSANRFPETLVALAFTDHAFTTGRRPSDATPAGAPTGGTR